MSLPTYGYDEPTVDRIVDDWRGRKNGDVCAELSQQAWLQYSCQVHGIEATFDTVAILYDQLAEAAVKIKRARHGR